MGKLKKRYFKTLHNELKKRNRKEKKESKMTDELKELAKKWNDGLTLDEREEWRDQAPDGLLGFNYFVECKGERNGNF